MTSSPPPEPDPDLIAAAVTGCSTVAGLSGGVAGAAATYLPGRRVVGVRIDDATVTVHVVGRYGPSMTEISNEVTRAVTPLAGGRQVGVVIEDLALPGEGDPPASSAASASPFTSGASASGRPVAGDPPRSPVGGPGPG